MSTISSHAAAIVTAGGIGRRMGGPMPKQFLSLLGRPIIIRTLERFVQAGCFRSLILTAPQDHLPAVVELLARYDLSTACRVVAGGETRQESVLAGLEALDSSIGYVLVHDGVRPLIDSEVIAGCLEAVKAHGAAIVAIPVKDTIKEADGLMVARTVDRERLWRAQTPQGARVDLLRRAYRVAGERRFVGTDEASLLELIGCPVALVPGSETNLKITLPEDISMAEALLSTPKETAPVIRVGHGYDAHRLVEGRALVLGGVCIPHSLGLLGHSDADVLTHALCDALLGALGAGDIGRHFPDSDPQYKGIESLKLLARVVALAGERGMMVSNADITVVAQRPKLAPHLPQMQKNLAEVCQVSSTAINIKATTTEGMGFAGREEGIACHAVAVLAPTG